MLGLYTEINALREPFDLDLSRCGFFSCAYPTKGINMMTAKPRNSQTTLFRAIILRRDLRYARRVGRAQTFVTERAVYQR